MIDDSINEPPAQDSGGSKVYIPLSAVATSDGTSPAQGDEVEFTVKGSVQSLEGDTACVVPSEINGQPAPEAPGATPPDDMHDKLMKQAENDDAMSGGGY